MFEQILSLIREHDTIVIHRHTSPDGDALGSQIGLKHIIQDNFPGKEVYMTGDEAGRYAFMADSVMDDVPDHVFPGALSIILDCAAAHLIADPRYMQAKAACRIDHHLFVGEVVPVEAVDSSSESCCGLIAAMAMEQNLTVSPAAAEALYTGMITDSGRFRYDATSPDTLRRAAFLLEKGIDTNEIFRNLYASDFDLMLLRAQYIQKIRFTPRKVAYIYTTRAELQKLTADEFSISRGMVSLMSDIRGVDIWVNFTETDRGVACELRSSRYNINPIAVKYGGGGHAKASGATLRNRAMAMDMLRDLDDMLEEQA
ncbi:MAG: bifunctional oligoribonuclease/PAP phosphatase NrnA [Clostridia bacterium]|nr:bifunctional oligoribonuclease/PAP phosphatase NrnA [Clostridia bacterium]